MKRDELVKALRCSNSLPEDRTCVCTDACPYYYLEEIPGGYRNAMKPDVVIDGVPYTVGCDYEGMAFDAAKMLEDDGLMLEDLTRR